jgi:putative oxidoreductase
MFMPYVLLLGRIFYSLIFILGGLNHFIPGTIAYANSNGVPIPWLLVPLAGIIAVVGGLSILLGLKAKWGGWLIAIFLVPITFIMHKFWGITDPLLAAIQKIMFMKNLSMLGGALIIAYFGSGPISLDEKRRKK